MSNDDTKPETPEEPELLTRARKFRDAQRKLDEAQAAYVTLVNDPESTHEQRLAALTEVSIANLLAPSIFDVVRLSCDLAKANQRFIPDYDGPVIVSPTRRLSTADAFIGISRPHDNHPKPGTLEILKARAAQGILPIKRRPLNSPIQRLGLMLALTAGHFAHRLADEPERLDMLRYDIESDEFPPAEVIKPPQNRGPGPRRRAKSRKDRWKK